MGPLFTQTENTTTSFINNTHNDFIQAQGGINSSIHNLKRYNNETNSPNLGNKGCLPVSQTVVPEHLASSNTEQELHMVELETLSQTKRLRELKLQQKKKTLLLLSKEANEIELDMQANCRATSQQNYSCRPKVIHGEYGHIGNDPKTLVTYNLEGQNSGYQNNTNRYLGHQGCNFINDTRVANNQVDNFQGNIHHNNTTVFNGYQARQNSNHNNTGSPGTLGTLCHKHRRFGENAYVCAAPRTCEMAGIRAQRPTKTDFPSSSQ